MNSTQTRGGAPPEEAALELPYDFPRTPGIQSRLEILDIDLPVTAPAPLLAAAFVSQLYRYCGQAVIPLSLSRLRLDEGEEPWEISVHLETQGGLSGGALAARIEELMNGHETPSTRPVKSVAAITWIDASEAVQKEQILARLERSGLASREADFHWVLWGAGGRAAFVYNAQLFARPTIGRFARHLSSILAHVVAHPEASLSRLPLLHPDEARWLEEVSHGRTCPPPRVAVHEQIERRAAATPEATALRHRDQRLSYAELNRRANQLAHYLISRGVGADQCVVVCVEPAFDIVIALLGILKAGAVYVPLDPAYPVARIRAILEDTKPALVLSRAALIDKLALGEFETLAFDSQAAVLEGHGGGNPGLAIEPSRTAYIYYTSGTTGLPKGVMASHANLMSYLQVAQDRYAFSSAEVMPAIARFSFSISMFELLSPLVAGGQLLILDRDHVLDLARMSRTLTEVTFFHAGPSLLRNLLAHIKRNHGDFGAFAGVRHASSGGDMIAPELLESLKEIFFNAEVFVIYGCSEISCMGCTYPVRRDRKVTKTYVGKPFDNMVVRVLDGALNPVPAGVVGEIHFAGEGIVKGYLNRPELTAEKFVVIGDRRYYRTGDLGRLSEDGWLEILGRNDFQIKVRGMRIELGEVEYRLRAAPGVRDGVVMAKEGGAGEKILVAYVVLEPAEAGKDAPKARISLIRRYLAENLPDYMVPSTYVELARMPLNHNMKLDRNALPEPERAQQRVEGDPALREPETATEKQLATLWKKLLVLDHVGLDDSFFELGGQSLLAMEFITEVADSLHVALEGMEVLRESLEVLASLCDERLGHAPQAIRKAAAPEVSGASRGGMETFYFGPDRSLYGVLHGGAGAAGGTAALICAPVGQEYVRTHFILSRLARTLAAQGVATLRFDYFGCWDSLGESEEASCERWQKDVAEAYHELKRRTKAARVVGIGARLGATLLCTAARDLDFTRWVFWDPVEDGAAFCDEMAEMRRKYLRSTRHLRLAPPRRLDGAREWLGTVFSEASLAGLRKLRLPLLEAGRPVELNWLITSHAERQLALYESLGGARSGGRARTVDFDGAWQEISQVDDIMPDVGIARALADLAGEKP